MTAFGDAIMASATFRLLKERIPDARITVVARRAAVAYFHSLGTIDSIIPFVDEAHIDRKRPWRVLRAWKDLWRIFSEIRSERWDAVLQWRSQFVDTLLAACASSKLKILGVQRIHRPAKFGAEELSFLYHDTVEIAHAHAHLVEAFAAPGERLLERWFISRGHRNLKLEYPICPKDIEEARLFLAQQDVKEDESLVLINISTKTSYNQWYDSRFAILADALQLRGHRVVLSGVPEHKEREAAIAAAILKPPLCSTGKLSMGAVAALARRCECIIALNTGIIHVAAALGVPVVVLNGRDGIDISPWKTEHEVVTKNEYYPRRHPDSTVWSTLVQRISAQDAIEGTEALLERLSDRKLGSPQSEARDRSSLA